MIPIAQPMIGPEEISAATRVLASSQIVQGQEVAAFEVEFARLVEQRHCVAVNSGTAALHLSLLAAGVGAGDEVIVPSFTFAATANAVALAGATPVFADIDAGSFCLDANHVESKIGPRTAAVVPVHLYGHPADMEAFERLAAKHGILVIEDAAQAHGAAFGGVPIGAWGDIAAFSFYATKNMTTIEGGMIVTKDEDVARRARLLRNQGMGRQFRNEMVGFNARLTDVAAAIGRVQLRKLDGWNEMRRQNAKYYDRNLRRVAKPEASPGAVHVYHQYTVRLTDRDTLLTKLRSEGIEAGVYYPIPVHRLPSLRTTVDLPVTDMAAREVLSLPIGPYLRRSELEKISRVVNDDLRVACRSARPWQHGAASCPRAERSKRS